MCHPAVARPDTATSSCCDQTPARPVAGHRPTTVVGRRYPPAPHSTGRRAAPRLRQSAAIPRPESGWATDPAPKVGRPHQARRRRCRSHRFPESAAPARPDVGPVALGCCAASAQAGVASAGAPDLEHRAVRGKPRQSAGSRQADQAWQAQLKVLVLRRYIAGQQPLPAVCCMPPSRRHSWRLEQTLTRSDANPGSWAVHYY